MSGIWQASVTHHSKLPEPLRHLLYLLADAANDAGIVDPAPNQETLAAMTGCSSRTVRTRMAAIVQSGELAQTRVGAGPGNPSAYKFLLPLPPNIKAETIPEKGGNNFRLDRLENELAQHALRIGSLEARMTSVEQQLAALTTAVTELTAIIKAEKGGNNHAIISAFADVKAETKPEKGGNCDGENRKKAETKAENTGNETGKRRKGSVLNGSDDPILIHLDPGEDPPTPQTSPPLSDAQKQLAAMVNALAAATGMSGHLNWAVLAGFAQELIALGYTPEQIGRHYSTHPGGNGSHKPAWNWYQQDWRGKKGEFPTIGAIRQTVSGAVDWEPPPPVNSNGHHTGAIDPAFVGSGGAY